MIVASLRLWRFVVWETTVRYRRVGLQEHMVVCDSSQKPLVYSVRVTNALVFTKSAESTLRPVQLFEFFEAARSDSQGDAA